MPHVEVIGHPGADDLARSVAARLAATIIQRQADGQTVRIVVTGGWIGSRVVTEVSVSPGRTGIDGSRLDVWWSDERFVPVDDPLRNDALTRPVFLQVLGVPGDRVHVIGGPPTWSSAQAAAEDYAQRLAVAAQPEDHGDVPAFDVALLSIGADAHVASLFPEHAALRASESVVAVHGAPKPPPTRVSLSMRALNSAREIWLLASGSSKATAVRLALDPHAGALQVPAAGARGRSRTLILLDAQAASELPPAIVRPEA